MQTAIKSDVLLVLFATGMIGAGGVVLATPSQSDITVVGLAQSQGGVPHCTLLDGAVKVTNTSTIYEYQVHVDAWSENDAYGNGRCATGAECEDSQEPCSCDFEVVITVSTDESKVGSTGCVFPTCDNCTNHCDNVDCDPSGDFDHCVCTYGTYEATHYREPPETNWTQMPPSFGSVITERASDSRCPDSPTTPCEY